VGTADAAGQEAAVMRDTFRFAWQGFTVRGFPVRVITVLSAGCLAALAAGTTAAWASNAGSVINASLNDVSCAGPGRCMAVGWDLRNPTGGSVSFTLAEAWNGRTWTILPSPTPRHPGGGAMLNAVSCPSSAACMAVGESLVFHVPGGNLVSHPLAEAWNGGTWTAVPTPALAHTGATLNGVSCTAPSSCMAVGSEGGPKNDTQFTFAESWNGSSWKFVPTPAPLTPGGTALNRVSCTSPASCMAVGYYGYNNGTGTSVTLAEAWNGTAWHRIHTSTPGSSGALAGVGCAAAAACTAVGQHAVNSAALAAATLAEGWNGKTWKTQPSPNPRGAGSAGFDDVSCPGPASCMATGSALDQTGESQFTLAEAWNGTSWRPLRTPSPGSFGDELRGVSCRTASSCLAVGDFTGTGNEFTLAEAWNGTSWTVIRTPRP
jgi:hypothetical protein